MGLVWLRRTAQVLGSMVRAVKMKSEKIKRGLFIDYKSDNYSSHPFIFHPIINYLLKQKN
jgi:hypothetical protein